MIKENENLDKKDKVKFDLYKILRMSILLNQGEVDSDTLIKFKDASVSIDKTLSEEYDSKIEDMFYHTDTLEEEEKRLKKLVSIIKERINERKNLINDYRTVTNRYLDDLEYINKSSELDLYEKRLSLIKEYLDNSRLLEIEKEDLSKLREDLVKDIDSRKVNEERNIKLEDELESSFVNSLYDMDLYNEIAKDDEAIDIDEIKKQIEEAKEQKDTFLNAFSNLKSSGISGELEIEYSSYVENAKRNYYYLKEKEILYKLYKLISKKEKEYSYLFSKREDVKELLKERLLLRSDLGIKDKDNLTNVYEVIKEQNPVIQEEKKTQESISVLTERIKIKEKKCDTLSKDLKKPEILSILSEYSLIDTYNNETVDSDSSFNEEDTLVLDKDEKDINESKLNYSLLDELLEESKKKDDLDTYNKDEEDTSVDESTDTPVMEEVEKIKTYMPNEIKSIDTVPTMNYGLSRLKSISVMKRVADMLGVKREVKEEIKEVPTLDIDKHEEDNTNKDNDLFWTPVELEEINKGIDTKEDNVIDSTDTPKENKVNEVNNDVINMNSNNNTNNNISNNNIYNNDSLFMDDKKDIFLNNDINNSLNSIVDNELNKKDDLFMNSDNSMFVNNNFNSDIFSTSNNNDIFGVNTSANNRDINSNINNNINNNTDIFNNGNNDNIFMNNNVKTNNGNEEIIFPEPIMPNNNQNKEEDKFMWPNNKDIEDINGIFPN